MANRVRNIVLRVPVTAEERTLIEKKMQQRGTRCFSVYARKMLIDGYVVKIDYSDIKAMIVTTGCTAGSRDGGNSFSESAAALRSASACSARSRTASLICREYNSEVEEKPTLLNT